MRIILLTIIFTLLVGAPALANTGWWQFTHEKPELRVLLSMAPLAPDVSDNVSFVISITNGTELIQEPLTIRLNITKNGKPTHLGNWTTVPAGIHAERIQFSNSGFHEIGIHIRRGQQFYFVDYPVGIHEANPTYTPCTSSAESPPWFLLTLLIFFAGYGLGRLIHSMTAKRKK